MIHPDLCPYCRAPIGPEQRQRINPQPKGHMNPPIYTVPAARANARELLQLVERGEITLPELTRLGLERIARGEP